MLKILQEVTDWKVPYRQPNHVYLMSGDRMIAMSRWGEGQPEYFKSQSRINRSGRKFIEVKRNPWGFDLNIKVEADPARKINGQTWTVSGSKGDQYTVSLNGSRWSCTCPGHGFRGRCRHVDELRASTPRLG
jgi:hypothetical protein